MTPPLSSRILGGVTRALVLKLAEADGRFRCEQRELGLEDLNSADEIWVTSSSKEILPIIELDGTAVGTGKPGDIWQYIFGIYQHYRDSVPAIENDENDD